MIYLFVTFFSTYDIQAIKGYKYVLGFLYKELQTVLDLGNIIRYFFFLNNAPYYFYGLHEHSNQIILTNLFYSLLITDKLKTNSLVNVYDLIPCIFP